MLVEGVISKLVSVYVVRPTTNNNGSILFCVPQTGKSVDDRREVVVVPCDAAESVEDEGESVAARGSALT